MRKIFPKLLFDSPSQNCASTGRKREEEIIQNAIEVGLNYPGFYEIN